MSTPNLNLSSTSEADGTSKTFLAWRLEQDGTANSNMIKIDNWSAEVTGSIVALQGGTVYTVSGSQATSTDYGGTNADIGAYAEGLVINLQLDKTNEDTSTALDIGGIGLVPLYKVNSSGTIGNIGKAELIKNRSNLFVYTSGYFLWINAIAPNQINLPNTSLNEIVTSSGSSGLTSGSGFLTSGSLLLPYGSFQTSGSAFIQGKIRVSGSSTIEGNSSILGDLNVSGSSVFSGSSVMQRDLDILGDLDVSGSSNFGYFPYTPEEEPSQNYHIANKKYIDDRNKELIYLKAFYYGEKIEVEEGVIYFTIPSYLNGSLVESSGSKVYYGDASATLYNVTQASTITASHSFSTNDVIRLDIVSASGSGLDYWVEVSL